MLHTNISAHLSERQPAHGKASKINDIHLPRFTLTLLSVLYLLHSSCFSVYTGELRKFELGKLKKG